MMKAAQAAYDANELYMKTLSEQMKAAKEKKKILREGLKREKALYKEHLKAMKASAVSAPASSGGAAPKQRVYADNYQNRKLGRVGRPIPSRKKVVGLPRQTGVGWSGNSPA